VVTIVPEADLDRCQAAQIAKRSRADLDNALTVLRDRVAQEIERAERLNNKSRQAFAIAAGFFALTQAGAFATFGESAISPGQRVWILLAAVAALLALALTASRLQQAERLREERGVNIESVLNWCLGEDEDKMITACLILASGQAGQKRVESNRTRAKQVEAVASATGLTLALCAAELFLALAVRI